MVVSSHGRERKEKAVVSSLNGTNPTMAILITSLSPKVPSLNTITLGVRASVYELEWGAWWVEE